MSKLNLWFLALEPGHQAALREDKWALAREAFEAGAVAERTACVAVAHSIGSDVDLNNPSETLNTLNCVELISKAIETRGEVVPVNLALPEKASFKQLILGMRFRYIGGKKTWVKTGPNLIAEWDGEHFADWVGQQICCFCAPGDGGSLDDLVEVAGCD